MQFDEYQSNTEATAIYPGAGTGSILALAYVGLGLGEAGEIQGKIKKILRDDNSEVTEEKRKELAKELGDLLWYVARACAELELSMNDVAAANLGKLSDRKARGVITGSGDNR